MCISSAITNTDIWHFTRENDTSDIIHIKDFGKSIHQTQKELSFSLHDDHFFIKYKTSCINKVQTHLFEDQLVCRAASAAPCLLSCRSPTPLMCHYFNFPRLRWHFGAEVAPTMTRAAAGTDMALSVPYLLYVIIPGVFSHPLSHYHDHSELQVSSCHWSQCLSVSHGVSASQTVSSGFQVTCSYLIQSRSYFPDLVLCRSGLWTIFASQHRHHLRLGWIISSTTDNISCKIR